VETDNAEKKRKTFIVHGQRTIVRKVLKINHKAQGRMLLQMLLLADSRCLKKQIQNWIQAQMGFNYIHGTFRHQNWIQAQMLNLS